MNEQSDIGLLIWGPQNTPGQERGVRAADGWGPAGLAPTRGFSFKHSWGQINNHDASLIQNI